MNYSKIVKNALIYLKYKGEEYPDKYISLINECISEIENENSFKNIYISFDKIIDVLQKKPYLDFLNGATKYIITLSTLGSSIDKKILYYSQLDLPKAIVFDATASAYLEEKADEYECQLIENPTFRFCPGYNGSPVEDVKILLKLLDSEKIGVFPVSNGIMLPQKTMVGIIGNSGKSRNCKNCIYNGNCTQDKENKPCLN